MSHWNASQKGFIPPDSQRRMKAATPGIYMKTMIAIGENREVEAILSLYSLAADIAIETASFFVYFFPMLYIPIHLCKI